MSPRQLLKDGLLALLSLPARVIGGKMLPVLTYHAVTDSPSPIAVSPGLFRRHVRDLRRAGYSSITFAEAIQVLDAGLEDDERRVCFTFDDAYTSVLENAAPVLEEAGFTATIFVPTGHVGDANRWDAAAPPREWPILSWPELRELSSRGFEMGSHTCTHPHLPTLDGRALSDELTRSRAEIEERLGGEVRTFCYPFGHHDERTRAAVRDCGYAGACTIEFGGCVPGHDRMRLPRLGTARLRTPYQLRAALGGAFELYARATGRAAPRPAGGGSRQARS
jgi:peptidoglycan/xylan/chitin deacetylase (PgdA/CDA1 family)